MTSHEYVRTLYQILLGREADNPGLRYWVNFIESSGNPTEVLAGILNSGEYRARNGQATVEEHGDKVAALASLLAPGRSLTIVDVGAQRLSTEEHIYQPLLNSGIPCHVIGFDPLASRLQERAEMEKMHNVTLLPYAIGDGHRHTLHINNVDSTSSLYPLNEEVVRRFADLSTLHTVRTESILTRRLDDVLTRDKVDFLKLDIQGFEVHALESAQETLRRTAAVHCEVEFTPIYAGQPLFFQVHDCLAKHGFFFVDYVNVVRLPLIVPSGRHYPETMIFGDGIFLRKSDRSDTDLHTVQALIALLVYRKPGLAEWLMRHEDGWSSTFAAQPRAPSVSGNVNASAPKAVPEGAVDEPAKLESYRAPIREFNKDFRQIEALSLSDDEKWRIAITTACHDCDYIEKVAGAGMVTGAGSHRYQLMHNGVRVLEDCYYGRWMTELIRLLRGHHEPQEEKLFHELLKHIGSGATMMEMGSFWSYYSLWFRRQIAGANNILVEPDPNNLVVGQRNFDINGANGRFINASAGRISTSARPFVCESDGLTREVPCVCVDDLISEQDIDRIELLLVDTQGAEFATLQGAARTIEAGKLRFAFISTHHHSISHDPIIHQRCLEFLRGCNAHIVAEHSVAESYSGDGLIVASFLESDRMIPLIEISRNRASMSLFREIEFDLADANDEISRMRMRIT